MPPTDIAQNTPDCRWGHAELYRYSRIEHALSMQSADFLNICGSELCEIDLFASAPDKIHFVPSLGVHVQRIFALRAYE